MLLSLTDSQILLTKVMAFRINLNLLFHFDYKYQQTSVMLGKF
jgi:hypothetical protein